MNALTHHPRRSLALGVALAIALLALLPSSWAEAQQGTAGSPTPITCPTGLTLQADGTCLGPVTIVNQQAESETTVVTDAGATVQTTSPGTDTSLFGRIALTVPGGALPAGSTVTVARPSEFSTQTSYTATPFGGTQTQTYTAVMSLTATDSSGNPITEDFAEPVTVRIALPNSTLDLASGKVVKVRNVNNAFDPPRVTEVTCVSVSLFSTEYDCELPHFSDWDLIIESTDLLPAESPPTAGGPAAPSPANTGMGDDDSGATNTVAIILGAVALAGIVGAGGRYAMGRRSA